MKTPVIRLLFFIITFTLVVILPWWVSAILLALLTIYFPFYIEVLFFGFLIDTLYSVQNNFPYNALTLAFVFLLVTMFVRTQIRT